MGRWPRGSRREWLAEENLGTGCLEETPPQGTVWRVWGRRGALCAVSSDVSLGCGVCPDLLSTSSRSRVRGAPLTPPPTAPDGGAHFAPLRTQGGGSGRGPESGEGGSPATVPGWVTPGRNLAGSGLTSPLGPGGSPSLCPGLLCLSKAFGSPAGVCFCSAGNSPESREKLGWAVAPGGGRGGSSRCGPKANIGGGGRFPHLGGEWVPGAGQCGEQAVGLRLAEELGVRRGRALSRASPAPSKALATSGRACPFKDLCLGFD